jgi:hypothetical protein
MKLKKTAVPDRAGPWLYHLMYPSRWMGRTGDGVTVSLEVWGERGNLQAVGDKPVVPTHSMTGSQMKRTADSPRQDAESTTLAWRG